MASFGFAVVLLLLLQSWTAIGGSPYVETVLHSIAPDTVEYGTPSQATAYFSYDPARGSPDTEGTVRWYVNDIWIQTLNIATTGVSDLIIFDSNNGFATSQFSINYLTPSTMKYNITALYHGDTNFQESLPTNSGGNASGIVQPLLVSKCQIYVTSWTPRPLSGVALYGDTWDFNASLSWTPQNLVGPFSTGAITFWRTNYGVQSLGTMDMYNISINTGTAKASLHVPGNIFPVDNNVVLASYTIADNFYRASFSSAFITVTVNKGILTLYSVVSSSPTVAGTPTSTYGDAVTFTGFFSWNPNSPAPPRNGLGFIWDNSIGNWLVYGLSFTTINTTTGNATINYTVNNLQAGFTHELHFGDDTNGDGNYQLASEFYHYQNVLRANVVTTQVNVLPSLTPRYGDPLTLGAFFQYPLMSPSYPSNNDGAVSIKLDGGAVVLGSYFNYSDPPTGIARMNPVTYSKFRVGTHTISVIYGVDANFQGQQLAVPAVASVTVSEALITTSSVSCGGPVTYGATVTFSAGFTYTVNQFGAPFANDAIPTVDLVGFYDGVPIPNATVNRIGNMTNLLNVANNAGTATATANAINNLTAGTHTIYALYNGSGSFLGAPTATCNKVINKASITTVGVSCSKTSPVDLGVLLSFTANFTYPPGLPTGPSLPNTVYFYYSGTNISIGTTDLVIINGSTATATLNNVYLPGGDHAILAIYGPSDLNYIGVQSAPTVAQVSIHVNRANMTNTVVSANTTHTSVGQNVDLSASFTFPPNLPYAPTTVGAVQFLDYTDNAAIVAVVDLPVDIATGTGSAFAPSISLSGGTHQIIAVFVGDTNYVPMNIVPFANVNVTWDPVNITTKQVGVVDNQIHFTYGSSIIFYANFSYPPNLVVAPTTHNQVTFSDNNTTSLGTTDLINLQALTGKADAVKTISSLDIGSHTVSAIYVSQGSFLGSQDSPVVNYTVIIDKASLYTTKVNSSKSTAGFGDSLTFNAYFTFPAGVTAAPAAVKVTFYDGPPANNISLGSASLVNVNLPLGTASASLSGIHTLALGSHDIYAIYLGDSRYDGLQMNPVQTFTQMIIPANITTVSVSSSESSSYYGDNLTITATFTFPANPAALPSARGIGGVPLVTFYDGDPSLILGTTGLVNINSGAGTAQAILVGINFLSVGDNLPHNIYAIYGGDANYTGVQAPSGNQYLKQYVFQAYVSTVGMVTDPANSVFWTYPITLITQYSFTPGVPIAPSPNLISCVIDYYENQIGPLINFDFIDTVTGTANTSITINNFTSGFQYFTSGFHVVGCYFLQDAQFVGSLAAVAYFTVTGVPIITKSVTSTNSHTKYGDNVTFTANFTFPPNLPFLPTGESQIIFQDDDGNLIGGAVDFIFDATMGTGTATSDTINTLTVGNHIIHALYIGDDNYTGVQDTPDHNLTQIVDPADLLTATVTALPGTNKYGEQVNLSATFVFNPFAVVPPTLAGKVNFYDGLPTNGILIAGSPVDLVMLIPGTGSASLSLNTLATTTHQIYAEYIGDINYKGIQYAIPDVANATEIVNHAEVITVSVLATPDHATYGDDVNFETHFTFPLNPPTLPSAVSHVSFFDPHDGTILAVADFVNIDPIHGTATASFTTNMLQVGVYTVQARYDIDINYVGVQLDSPVEVNLTVNQDNIITTAVGALPATANYGEDVVLQAYFTFTSTNIVVLPTTTNMVTFYDQNLTNIMGVCDLTFVARGQGLATFHSNHFPVGNYVVYVVYGTDRNFRGNQMAIPVSVNVAINKGLILTVAVTSSAPTCQYGDPLLLSAKFTWIGARPLTPTTQNTVSFYTLGEISQLIGTANLSSLNVVLGTGVATLAGVNYLPIGNYTIMAVFNDDDNFRGVQASPANSQTQVVNQAYVTTVSLKSSSDPSRYGDPLTFTAGLRFTPGVVIAPTDDRVIFYDGTPANYLASSDLLNINTTLGTATASFSITTPLEIGAHTIYALYTNDDPNYDGQSIVAVSQVVDRALVTTTGITSDQPSLTSKFGDIVLFTAFFSFRADLLIVPTGFQKVSFYDGFRTLVAVTDLVNIVNGTASATIGVRGLLVGVHTLYAVYGDDAHFIGDQSLPIMFTIKHTVEKGIISAGALTVDSPTSMFPNPVSFTALFTFTPDDVIAPTGENQVIFYETDPSHPLGPPVNLTDINVTAGTASAKIILSLLVGVHNVYALFNSDAEFVGGVTTNHVTHTVLPDIIRTASIWSSSTPSRYGDVLTLFAAFIWQAGGVAPSTSNQVTFYLETTATVIGIGTIQSANVTAGTATGALTLTAAQTLSVGNHTILAQFKDDGYYFGGQIDPVANFTQEIIKALVVQQNATSDSSPSVYSFTITLTIPFTFTPTIPVAPTKGHMVTIYDGNTPLGVTDLVKVNTSQGTGQATLKIATLAVGNHIIYGVYGEDANYIGFTNQSVNFFTQVIIPAKSHGIPSWPTIQSGAKAVLKGSNITCTYTPATPGPTFSTFFFKDPIAYSYAKALATTKVYQISASTGVKMQLDKGLIVRLFLYASGWPVGVYTWTSIPTAIESSNHTATLSTNKKTMTVSGAPFDGVISFPAGTTLIQWQGDKTNHGTMTYSIAVLTPLVETTLTLPNNETTVNVALGGKASVTVKVRTTAKQTIPTQGNFKFTFRNQVSTTRSGPKGQATFISPALNGKGTFPLLIEFPQLGKYDVADPLTVNIVVN